MANQMIALQARGPQLPDLGAAAAKYGNMMANMAVMKEKQAGIQRANAFRQLVSDPGFDPANPEHIKAAQSLDPAGAEKIVSAADARRKANLEYVGELTQQFRDQLAVIDPSDKAAYGALREEIVKAVPGWGSRLPTAEQWGPDARVRTLMKADDVISKTIATPTASVQVSPTGTLQAVTVGGIGEPSAKEIPEYRYVPDQPPPAGGAAPAGGVRARATRGSATTPQDLLDQGVDPRSIPMGNPLQPMSFGGEGMGAGAIQPLTMETAPQIIQTAVQNGVIDQSHVEQLRQMVGPENDQALANWMRQNNVRIQPTGAPSMRSAVYRQPAVDYFAPQVADDGMPFGGPAAALRQNIGYEPTGRAAQAKPPLQSPRPGSAIVPLPRVRNEAGASETGKGEAAADVELRKNLPKARGALSLAVKQLDRDLADIDYVLRTPQRAMIVGAVEGRMPSVLNVFRKGGQEAQNVQSRINKIKAQSVVTHLKAMRESSPQGSSLFGQVTEYEDRLVSALAGLDQAQDEPTFDRALQTYRDVIVDMREHLPQVFNDTYSRVGGKASVTSTPPGGKAGPTIQDIEYLKRNIRKPNVAKGFAEHFGMDAFNEAIGRR